MKLTRFKNLHIYFFYLFLLSIPFQTRKVFLTEYSFYSGAFTEYATFFMYASDILLILTLFFWLFFNKKTHEYLSAKNLYSKINLLIHIGNSRFRKNNKGAIFRRLFSPDNLLSLWSLLPVFLVWLIISTIINNSHAGISMFYVFKFIEFSLLILYIYFNLKDKNRLITAVFMISFTGFFQGLVAIYQFAYQSPLFKNPLLHRLAGESTVYPQVSGIAKIIVDNEKFIRSYGTFPHPNLLGSFLIISILSSTYLLLKHKNYILSILNLKYNNTNNNKSQLNISSLLQFLFWTIFIFTQIMALLFTFSRTAWVGFFISIFLLGVYYIYRFIIVSRETIIKNPSDKKFTFCVNNRLLRKLDNLSERKRHSGMSPLSAIVYVFVKINLLLKNSNRRNSEIKFQKHIRRNLSLISFLKKCFLNSGFFCHFKELIVITLLTIILIAVYSPHINGRMNEELSMGDSSPLNYLPSNYAFSDRIFYNNVSRETISKNFIFGSGPGTFIFQIDGYLAKNNTEQKIEPWQYQPAHNVYLLIISEIGIIGFVTFALFIVKIIVYNFSIAKKQSDRLFFLSNNISNVNNVPIVSRETIFASQNYELNYYLFSIFIAFLFIGLFDHYFWTLQQGRLMFWLILGMMLVSNCDNKKIRVLLTNYSFCSYFWL